jgi:hypothetical protein
MRKAIIYIIAILFIISCRKKARTENNGYNFNLKGNWSLITNDSIYYEILIDNDSILMYNYDYSFLPSRDYKIRKDSLVFGFPNTKAKHYLINKIDSNEIHLTSELLNRPLELHKMDTLNFTFDKISSDEDLLKYEINYLNRKNKLYGIKFRYNLDSIKAEFDSIDIPTINQLDSL